MRGRVKARGSAVREAREGRVAVGARTNPWRMRVPTTPAMNVVASVAYSSMTPAAETTRAAPSNALREPTTGSSQAWESIAGATSAATAWPTG